MKTYKRVKENVRVEDNELCFYFNSISFYFYFYVIFLFKKLELGFSIMLYISQSYNYMIYKKT